MKNMTCGSSQVFVDHFYCIIPFARDDASCPIVSIGRKMLERFKVPAEDQVHVAHESLRETVSAIFEKMGEPPKNAEAAANTLVTADLWGVETHGVSNMVKIYIERYGDGRTNADPQWRVTRETKGTAIMDADQGLAIILGPIAMQMAIEKAKEVGVGYVSMVNAGHSGALGVHAMVAAQQDMLGLVMTTGGQRMVPTFGSKGMLGTNPIAFAAPARNEAPFVFDAAMTGVAQNKLRIAERLGVKLYPGWLADDKGTPTMEEIDPPDDDNPPMLPFGATRELGSHKGYGLAMMVTIMGTLMAGQLPAMLTGQPGGEHVFIAFNIEAFTDTGEFKDNIDQMLRTLRETKPAPGHDRVLYAGLSEHEEEQKRRDEGIPLHREVVDWFDDIAGELEIPRLRRQS
jgi:L-2-hydroxycarboxylate dehydrogenase (NAD+)